jgi:AraC family transcriptional activator of pobA
MLSSDTWEFDGTSVAGCVLLSGQAELIIREAELMIPECSFIWLPRGNIARFTVSPGARGMVLVLPGAALESAMPLGLMAAPAADAAHRIHRHIRLDMETLEPILDSFEAISRELHASDLGAADVISANLRLILIYLWRLARVEQVEQRPSPHQIVQKFMAEVDLRLGDHPTVSEIAKTIGVSKDRLNTAIRRATGQSPKQVIHARLMSEAEMLLRQSPLQIAQISAVLGFSDVTYFSRFFKARAGVPPARHRRESRKRERNKVENFAAWP